MEITKNPNDDPNHQSLYPDLVEAGGLGQALLAALRLIGSDLKPASGELFEGKITYARIEKANRFSQFYTGAKERCFIIDFWRDGVMYANASTPDIHKAAEIVDLWVERECSLDELDASSIVELQEDARPYDQGVEVEHRWQTYLASAPSEKPEIEEVLRLAAKQPELRQLFPFTSLFVLCFSRCTGYPFTQDCPAISPNMDGTYSVLSANNFGNKTIGTGDACWAVKTAIEQLPANCGPAVRGTNETVNFD